MASEPDVWDELGVSVEQLSSAIRKVKAVAVNSTSLKSDFRETVQFYFRKARQSVIELGIEDSELEILDAAFQTLNDLAQGNNRKKSYADNLKVVRAEVSKISIVRFRLLGARAEDGKILLTSLQTKIITTLARMLPLSANSFAQALTDLTDGSRLSYRGPAAEMREVLREVIELLAPDKAVIEAPGFKFEKDSFGRDRTAPTMKQKVKFIFKTRGKSGNEISSAEDTIGVVEATPAELARSIYNQGSAATHTVKERKSVLGLARYTEVLLADLLEVD